MKTINAVEIRCPVLNFNVLVMEFNGDKYCPACLQDIQDTFEHKEA